MLDYLLKCCDSQNRFNRFIADAEITVHAMGQVAGLARQPLRPAIKTLDVMFWRLACWLVCGRVASSEEVANEYEQHRSDDEASR